MTPSPTMSNSKSKVDRTKCIGCGVCVIECASEAIEMVPVSAEEWFHVPSSMAEWEDMRLQNLAANESDATTAGLASRTDFI